MKFPPLLLGVLLPGCTFRATDAGLEVLSASPRGATALAAGLAAAPCPWPAPPSSRDGSFLAFERLLALARIQGWPGTGTEPGNLTVKGRLFAEPPEPVAEPADPSACPWPAPPANLGGSWVAFQALLGRARWEGWPGTGTNVGDLILTVRYNPADR